MKKIILAITVLALAAAGIQTAKAGDRGWGVAGKVFAGAMVADAINHAVIDARYGPAYYRPAPVANYGYHYGYCAPGVVYAPPVYCAPAPLFFAPRFGRDFGHFRHGHW